MPPRSQAETYKALLAPLRAAMVDFDSATVLAELRALSSDDALFRLCHPLGDSVGADAYFDRAYRELLVALPDLERRDTIVIAGDDQTGQGWVGCCGYYSGNFVRSWLDIPPTGHLVAMRFHEFYRFADGKLIEMQAIWDIPEVMMQAGAWPMSPSLGREWQVPGPATQDGLAGSGEQGEEEGRRSCQLIIDMLTRMQQHPAEGGPELMQLERFWHPRMNWYGPAGIGTARGIEGFRRWHQKPFLRAMPDRGQHPDKITPFFFGERQFAAVTGWPDMAQTLTGDGWLGIAASGRAVTLRSLDFWRVEGERIRENWVLVDLLDLYQQLDVDVLARVREFNQARVPGAVAWAGAKASAQGLKA